MKSLIANRIHQYINKLTPKDRAIFDTELLKLIKHLFLEKEIALALRADDITVQQKTFHITNRAWRTFETGHPSDPAWFSKQDRQTLLMQLDENFLQALLGSENQINITLNKKVRDLAETNLENFRALQSQETWRQWILRKSSLLLFGAARSNSYIRLANLCQAIAMHVQPSTAINIQEVSLASFGVGLSISAYYNGMQTIYTPAILATSNLVLQLLFGDEEHDFDAAKADSAYWRIATEMTRSMLALALETYVFSMKFGSGFFIGRFIYYAISAFLRFSATESIRSWQLYQGPEKDLDDVNYVNLVGQISSLIVSLVINIAEKEITKGVLTVVGAETFISKMCQANAAMPKGFKCEKIEHQTIYPASNFFGQNARFKILSHSVGKAFNQHFQSASTCTELAPANCQSIPASFFSKSVRLSLLHGCEVTPQFNGECKLINAREATTPAIASQ